MEHTSNYELSKWAESDRILMEDFNMDHDKIDAALADVAASGLAVKTGSFSGNGTTGTRTYNIGAKPKLVIARTTNTSNNSVHETGIMITDFMSLCFSSSGNAYLSAAGYSGTLIDTGFTINHSSATTGLNASGSTLYYWALC